MDNIETELNTTKGKVTTAESNITNLQTRMTTNEGKDTAQDTTLTTHTGQITALQGQVGAAIGVGAGGAAVGIAGGAASLVGGAGAAASGISAAMIGGLAGLGGALLGVGIGVLVSQDPNTGGTTGNPETYSYQVAQGTLSTTNGSFQNLTVGNLFATVISTGTLAFIDLNVTNNTFANINNTNLVSSTSTISNLTLTNLTVGNIVLNSTGTLRLAGNINAGSITASIGTLVTTNATITDMLKLKSSSISSFSRTFGTVGNQVGNIASYTAAVGTCTFRITVITSQANSASSSEYIVANSYHSTTKTWRRLIPISRSVYLTDLYDLQININNNLISFRLLHTNNSIASQVNCKYYSYNNSKRPNFSY